MFVDCALELGVISTEDIGRLASREIQRDTNEEFSIKTTLEMVNLLTNMYSIRKNATESALKFLFTNVNDNDFETPGTLKRKSTFESVNNKSDESGPKRKRIEWTVINKACSKTDHVVTSEATIDEYDLGEFSISDTGIINLDGGLMFNYCFLTLSHYQIDGSLMLCWFHSNENDRYLMDKGFFLCMFVHSIW